ncbi:MAG: hypothetical protein CK538_02285 [Opitutia bacterium]|nr:MAG: hypothetical protein CK538_02285 [Opitutae bacterium]
MIALPRSPNRSQGSVGTSGPDRFGPATPIGRARRSRPYLVTALALLFAGCTATNPPPAPLPAPVAVMNPADVPPPAPREFRGAWVATVANIDWPSKPGLPTVQQRAEMLTILDRAQTLRLNAIVLQVRPAADAIYPSSLEPWSEFLTGKQGRAPEPLYDPLREWIAESHRRGLELHAWFNPYRARHQRAISELDPSHLAKTHPGVVKTYGELMWMDPGEPVAQKRTLDVVREVVRNYDLDGVHLDDYFYPYPVADRRPAAANAAALTNPGAAPAAKNLEFPDGPAWQRYLATGGKLSRADWRRQNVNQLVEALYRGIRSEKNHVRFGISPFGIGRPDRRPAGISGFSQYDQLYADVELWIERGWMDYLTPQLYWPRAQKAQAFGVLLDYWAAQNPRKRHLWPGLYTSQVSAEPKPWEAAEITGQIELLRTRPAATGHVHFSMVPLLKNARGLNDALAAGPYATPALVPATPWLDSTPPPAPTLAIAPATLVITPGAGEIAANFAIWLRYGGDQWRFTVQPAGAPSVALVADAKLGVPDRVVVTAVDRLGNESARVALPLVSPGTPVAQR